MSNVSLSRSSISVIYSPIFPTVRFHIVHLYLITPQRDIKNLSMKKKKKNISYVSKETLDHFPTKRESSHLHSNIYLSLNDIIIHKPQRIILFFFIFYFNTALFLSSSSSLSHLSYIIPNIPF